MELMIFTFGIFIIGAIIWVWNPDSNIGLKIAGTGALLCMMVLAYAIMFGAN